MTVLINAVRRGAYADSVALMRLSSELSAQGGVAQVAVVLGKPLLLTPMKDQRPVQTSKPPPGFGISIGHAPDQRRRCRTEIRTSSG